MSITAAASLERKLESDLKRYFRSNPNKNPFCFYMCTYVQAIVCAHEYIQY